MGDVVNLRQARKARRRRSAKTVADRNAAAHGVSKAERRAAQDAAESDARRLDGHRRDGPAERTEYRGDAD